MNGYGLIKYPNPPPIFPEPIKKVEIKEYDCRGFEETPNFWLDLVEIGEKISKCSPDERY